MRKNSDSIFVNFAINNICNSMMLGTLPRNNFVDWLGIIMTTATFVSVVLRILIRRGKFGSARQSTSDLT